MKFCHFDNSLLFTTSPRAANPQRVRAYLHKVAQIFQQIRNNRRNKDLGYSIVQHGGFGLTMGEYFWFVQKIDTEIQIPSIFLWQLFWAASLWLEVTLGNKITLCLQLSWAANSQSFVVVFPIWLEMDEACGSVRPVALCCKRIGEWGHWVPVCAISRVKTRYIGCPRKKVSLRICWVGTGTLMFLWGVN